MLINNRQFVCYELDHMNHFDYMILSNLGLVIKFIVPDQTLCTIYIYTVAENVARTKARKFHDMSKDLITVDMSVWLYWTHILYIFTEH